MIVRPLPAMAITGALAALGAKDSYRKEGFFIVEVESTTFCLCSVVLTPSPSPPPLNVSLLAIYLRASYSSAPASVKSNTILG